LGIFDEIGNDDDEELARLGADRSSGGDWHEMDGKTLLRAERAGGSAALVKLGALGARLAALPSPAREAWALLNLDRVMRRVLASAGLEPADLLPHLIGGAQLPFGSAGDAGSARFLLCAILPLIAGIDSIDGAMAARLLQRLRPARMDDREQDLWLEEQRAIDEITAVASDVRGLLAKRLEAADPLFAVTDLLATYGAALNGFALHHLPDNSGASRAELILETFRNASSLPPQLSRARYAVPDGALISVFDVAVTACLVERLVPMPPLTGLVRRDLFRRDLHYPADLGSLIAALRASIVAAERDLALVSHWAALATRSSARVQLLALTILSCFGQARPSSIETLAVTTWQGLETALAKFESSGLVQRDAGLWRLASLPDRDPSGRLA
jgi:hypothetical protein